MHGEHVPKGDSSIESRDTVAGDEEKKKNIDSMDSSSQNAGSVRPSSVGHSHKPTPPPPDSGSMSPKRPKSSTRTPKSAHRRRKVVAETQQLVENVVSDSVEKAITLSSGEENLLTTATTSD